MFKASSLAKIGLFLGGIVSEKDENNVLGYGT